MIRLSNRIIKAGTIGLAAMMLFTNVAFADEVPNNVGIASYDAGEATEAATEEIGAEAGIAAWLSGDTAEEETVSEAEIETTAAEQKEETKAPEQQAETTAPADTGDQTQAAPAAEEEEHASILALEKRRAKYDSLYKDLVFPDIDPDSDSYINIREKATADSELVGKIYAQSAARVLETVDGEDGPWFKISSGSVTGYVKAYYFITGAAAEEMAKNYGDLVAVINTESLRLREKASLESEQIAILSEDDSYPVVGEEGAFVKVQVDEDLVGFVLDEYITLKVIYKKAISVEEERAAIQREIEREEEAERARREAEEEAERARREAERDDEEPSGENTTETKSSSETKKEETKKQETKEETKKSETKKEETKKSETKKEETKKSYESTSSLRKAIVKYALSFVGELQYVYGGDSLRTGTDCSGFTKLIYAKFGISLPRASRAQQYSGRAVSSSNMRPGDILYYGGHVAIYIGDGKIVHAANRQTDVKVSRWNYRRPITIRNVIGD